MVTYRNHRLSKYHKMSVTKIAKPESLPPTEGAARQHILRSYLQYHDWALLNSMTLSSTKFGWKLVDDFYSPVFTDDPIAPPELLKITVCNCKDCNS